MPSRSSTTNREPPTPLRRSPRFLRQENAPDTPDPKTPKYRSIQVLSSEPSLSSKRAAPARDTNKHGKAEVSRKSSERSRNCENLGTGSAKSPGLNHGVEGSQNLRRSPRLVNQQKPKERVKTTGGDGSSSKRVSSSSKAVPAQETRVSTKSSAGSRNCENLGSGSVKPPGLNNGVNGSKRISSSREAVPAQETWVSKKSSVGSRNCENLGTASVKSPGLNNGVNGFRGRRQSLRLANQQQTSGGVKKSVDNEVLSDIGNFINGVSSKSTRKKVLSEARKVEVGKNLCGQYEYEEVKVGGGEGKVREEKGREGNEVKRKRKRDEDSNGVFHGWTNEQERALQRAYFASKPTPHFWKKVAKLVPGKTAQECFDKIHSNDLTPPQPPRRSRAKKPDASPVDSFSLSASKMLMSTNPNGKRPTCSKRKSHVAQKNVRHLLQKHYHVKDDCETDLFSVLEPNTDPSARAVQPSVIPSTPEHLLKKMGFLQKCRERSSSGRKKAISRFSSSYGNVLVSPPVLKQVKNRALHEKYIDRLHCREAKRKAVSARSEKFFTVKEGKNECHVQKLDAVRAAKDALLYEARDAIGQLQRLHANAISNSSDCDDDEGVSNDDDEGEDEL